MKADAVLREIFVLDIRVTDAGVEVCDSHLAKAVLESVVEKPADAVLPAGFIHVDRELDTVVVRPAVLERSRVGIADGLFVNFCNEIRVPRQRFLDPSAELAE